MRILIADDHELYSRALRFLLSDCFAAALFDEVAGFDPVRHSVERGERFDLVTLDLRMPGMNSVDGVRFLRMRIPDARVVVVSASHSRDDIVDALDAGAHGYIPKSASVAEMAAAFAAVMSGAIFVPRHIADLPAATVPVHHVHTEIADSPVPGSGTMLSARQREVLELLVRGLSNKAIARALDISEGTVKIHVASIFRYLKVCNRAAAAIAGLRLLVPDRREGVA